MLVKIVDHKGKPRWINPIYIKSLIPKGDDATDIEVSGWATKVRVRQHADEVALAINAAMPDAAAYIAAQEDERARQQAQTAATTAVIG